MTSEPVTFWRCAACGKWSHAQRRPRHHQRFVHRADGLPEEAKVLREEEGFYDHEGNGSDGGWFVACGPFDGWTATPV